MNKCRFEETCKKEPKCPGCTRQDKSEVDLQKGEKKKVSEAEIVVHGTKEKPYYEIKYREIDANDYSIGYSSYDLNNCFKWLEEEFEIVEKQPVEEKAEEKDTKSILEKRIRFAADFCSAKCPGIKCSHRYDATKCESLYNALVKKGFIKEWTQPIIEEEKVVQFPVDIGETQKNILIELLSARKECTDENLLTARGYVATIDALFYLVKEKPFIPTFINGSLPEVGNEKDK